jgi:hypothetical protein
VKNGSRVKEIKTKNINPDKKDKPDWKYPAKMK